jgi:hypothetical protein
MPTDQRLRRALDASIGWYEDLFALHGISTSLDDGVWRSLGPPPPLHSDVVTVEPAATADAVNHALAGRPTWGFKDSFATVRPAGASVELLFEAAWIHREAAADTSRSRGSPWRRVASVEELARWNAGWDTAAVLLPDLLKRAHFAILGRFDNSDITAGAVARLGSGTVDLSNVHPTGDAAVDWEELIDAVAAEFPGRDVVGYERGEDLDAANAAGFESVGPLRVWIGRNEAV